MNLDTIVGYLIGDFRGVGFYDWREVDMPAYRERVSAPYWNFFNWEMPKD